MADRFVFLEHTADALFEARGKSFTGALENAAGALFAFVGESDLKKAAKAEPKGADELSPAKAAKASSKQAGEKLNISESAGSREELVVFFLSKLLSEMDSREMVFTKAKITSYDEKKHSVSAEVWGTHARPLRSVKAVTFHMLRIEESKAECKIRVLLDV